MLHAPPAPPWGPLIAQVPRFSLNLDPHTSGTGSMRHYSSSIGSPTARSASPPGMRQRGESARSLIRRPHPMLVAPHSASSTSCRAASGQQAAWCADAAERASGAVAATWDANWFAGASGGGCDATAGVTQGRQQGRAAAAGGQQDGGCTFASSAGEPCSPPRHHSAPCSPTGGAAAAPPWGGRRGEWLARGPAAQQQWAAAARLPSPGSSGHPLLGSKAVARASTVKHAQSPAVAALASRAPGVLCTTGSRRGPAWAALTAGGKAAPPGDAAQFFVVRSASSKPAAGLIGRGESQVTLSALTSGLLPSTQAPLDPQTHA